jgi:GAF domain-containing protein
MGRGSNRAKGSAKRAAPRKAQRPADARVRDLEKRLAEAVGQLETRDRELAEAQEQLTATSEILRVISSSPTDYQPVFDTIVRRAGVVCGAVDAILWTVDGGELVVRAHHGPIPATIGARQPMQGSVAGGAAREARVIHVEDLTQADDFPVGREIARRVGWRTTLSAPLLRGGVAIGALLIRRSEVRPFTDRQIALLQTFADEAVIALENVRLFTDLQTSNRELTAALEQQTATSEILRAITHAPTDTQPVFDTIVRSAAALCHAGVAAVFLTDGKMVFAPANYGSSPEALDAVRARFPRPLDMESSGGAAILTRSVVHVPDIEEPSEGEWVRQNLRRLGVRSLITVPMLRDGAAVGAVGVYRREPGRFSNAEVTLLQTFADQAVIAIENVRLFTELQEKNQALTTAHAQVTEALEQQTATSEILRVISTSPTDAQSVFDTIIQNAVRLLGGFSGVVTRRVDGQLHLAAVTSTNPSGDAAQKALWPKPLTADRSVHGRVITSREPVVVADVESDRSVPPEEIVVARARGYQSIIAVPLVREGRAVGSMAVTRRTPGPFSDSEIALLRTFADQAVIAIENVRMFTELQASNKHLTDALDKQTATSDILRAISRSQSDVQPVFEAILSSAVRLLGAYAGALTRVVNNQIELAAFTRTDDAGAAAMRAAFPQSLHSELPHAQAIRDRAPLNIADAQIDSRLPEAERVRAGVRGYRSRVLVPLLRQDEAIGAISVARREPGGFNADEILLLQTFADQAVIAIENVRLFKELQASNKHLTDALDKQTATGDILRVVSRSQTDVQPVFEEILSSALRLMGAQAGALTRITGDHLDLAALKGADEWGGETTLRELFPVPLHGDGAHASAIRTRMPINIGEAQNESSEGVRSIARAVGYQSLIVVPMLHHEAAVGAITAVRREPGGFSEDEIALVQTFADQAVIAIENARLLSELQARTGELSRSVEQLTALGEVGRAVSSTLDLETVLTTIVSRAVELSGLDGGVVFEYDEGAEEFVHRVATEAGEALAEARRSTRVRKGEGVVGRTALTLEPAQVADIAVPGAYESRLRENLIASGIRAVLAVPMVREGELIGCLVVSRNRPGDFTADTIELLRTFATQSALAIQNARLFREIELKSRELEAASRHKSEFLANMSHELRTPLNAIIGFSEVLSERLFGELNAKQDEYLKDIHASGQHLLSLINDILDLSKIEAGRMELELSNFDLPTTIDNALTLVRERAGRRGIALHKAVDARLGQIEADERKLRQVLLNLLSNAIKFTPEGGRIEVGAQAVNGAIEVSVTDTGVGIAPEDQEAVFEEFRQVGTAEKKVEGTGLGLALSRKFIELHGGRISVKSQVGQGSTFTFTMPVRRE